MAELNGIDGIERLTGANPQASIIWLHGLGADASDFEPIIPELVRPNWPALRFVFPNAPIRPITINAGMSMRGWYDLHGLDAASPEDEPGMRQSVARLDALIEREIQRGMPPTRIFIAGFSQGGAIAMAALIRRSQPLAGAILLSTYLPLSARSAAAARSEAATTPVFMAHGVNDTVLPFAWGEQSAQILRTLGYSVDWHRYPMQHSVSGQEIEDLSAWLQGRFDRFT